MDYVILATDSAKNSPLDSVRIRVTTITGDTSTYETNTGEGRAQLATVASSRTLFELSRNGYSTRDTIDTVNSRPDSVFHRPVARLLRIKLTRLGTRPAGRAQFAIAFRNTDLEKLRKAKVSFTDSLNSDKTVTDTDSDGTVELAGLKVGKQTVLVEHPGYLGKFIEINVEKLADSVTTLPGTTVSLVPRTSAISGQVLYKTVLGAKPLADAKVEFVLKDSLYYPSRFSALTSAKAGSEGAYVITEVPALDGEVRFYKNRTAPEPTLSKPITKAEVLMDGPSPAVTLAISSDSTGLPVADSLPKDTLNAKDTLVFHFNQPVARLNEPVVRLVNISNRLFTVAAMDTAKRTLKVVQKEDDWIAGKTYAYEIAAANAEGQGFTRVGDTSTVIRGSFFVREKAVTDSTLRYPQGVHVAFFNSGNERRFDSLASETSPLGDSTTRFARLKWNWNGATGNRVDSILVWIKDNGAAAPSWTQWTGIPGAADSATLDFAELYSTSGLKTTKAAFPLRVSANEEIQIKVLFYEGGRTLDSQVVLPSVKQGMGPTVYVHYGATAGLKKGNGARDSLDVWFSPNAADTASASAVDFGSSAPIPKLYEKGKLDDNNSVLTWHWVTGKKARLIYSFGSADGPREFAAFRVDLNGQSFQGKPVWQRNPQAAVDLP